MKTRLPCRERQLMDALRELGDEASAEEIRGKGPSKVVA